MIAKRIVMVSTAIAASLLLALSAAGADKNTSQMSCDEQARAQGIVEAKSPEEFEGFMIKCMRQRRAAERQAKQKTR